MSTFTRLYFVDRGPSIAQHESHEPLDEAGADFGSPDTAPSDPAADPDLLRKRDAEATLSRIPQSAVERGSDWIRQSQPDRPMTRRDAWPGGDADAET